MKYFTNQNPLWLQEIAPPKFNDKDLFRIVVFFVFHSPCPKQSARGKTLHDYKWNDPWKEPYYLNKQLKESSSNPDLMFSFSNYEKADSAFRLAELGDDFPSNLSKERICVYDSEKNQFMSVFRHIRNAFAHGRLNMVDVNDECIFVLEDIAKRPKKGDPNQRKVSARMILRKSTLLKWIKLIEGGEQTYEKFDVSRGGKRRKGKK